MLIPWHEILCRIGFREDDEIQISNYYFIPTDPHTTKQQMTRSNLPVIKTKEIILALRSQPPQKKATQHVDNIKHEKKTMKNVGIYLTFDDGKCLEAFEFYRQVFGGEFGWKGLYGDSPLAKETPKSEHHHIMHISLTIANHKFDLMGSDRSSVMSQGKTVVGTNVQISLTPDTKEEADELFAKLSGCGEESEGDGGGVVEMPMEDQFWGSYFGCCKDKYGTRWMIDCPSGTGDALIQSELKLVTKQLREAAGIATKQAALLEKLLVEKEEGEDENAPATKHKAASSTTTTSVEEGQPQAKKFKV